MGEAISGLRAGVKKSTSQLKSARELGKMRPAFRLWASSRRWPGARSHSLDGYQSYAGDRFEVLRQYREPFQELKKAPGPIGLNPGAFKFFRINRRSKPTARSVIMTIPKVSLAVRQYLASFDSIAIVLTSKGSLLALPNPTGYEAAFWVKKTDAQRLLEEARERGDVEAAARRLGIAITPHDICLMRVDRQLARLDSILVAARRNGHLREFNRAYKAKRLAAVAKGGNFMPYHTAEKRLQRALVEVIAAGVQGREFETALATVFK
jgi:hypothetical protein